MVEQASPPEVTISREARWFRVGPLPAYVEDWFTNGGTLGWREQRVDFYDLISAGFGVGLKQRGAQSLDAKFLLGYEADLQLAERIRGRVEDWIKVSKPIAATVTPNGSYVEVKKDILTRRYSVEGDHSLGCEIELTSVTAGDRDVWTMCLETFGDGDRRREALPAGVDGLLADTPLPSAFELTADSSCGYPEWIGRYLAR